MAYFGRMTVDPDDVEAVLDMMDEEKPAENVPGRLRDGEPLTKKLKAEQKALEAEQAKAKHAATLKAMSPAQRQEHDLREAKKTYDAWIKKTELDVSKALARGHKLSLKLANSESAYINKATLKRTVNTLIERLTDRQATFVKTRALAEVCDAKSLGSKKLRAPVMEARS